MVNCSEDFSDFDGRIWLNSAHQGALPLIAAREAHEAIAWKLAPYHLTTERFTETPLRLKTALGKLINAPAEEIILGNSASYGMHLLANGLPLRAGDEVIVMDGDFPTNILPWLGLRERGIVVRPVTPSHQMIEPKELSENLTKSSRIVCLSWVHSFSGFAADIESIGRLCKSEGVRFIVNCSQALGTRPLDSLKIAD